MGLITSIIVYTLLQLKFLWHLRNMNVCFVFDSDDDEDGGTEEETEEEEEEEEVVKPTKIKFIKGQSRCN